ncbi:MAG: PhnB protein [Acidobacteriota bacterium]
MGPMSTFAPHPYVKVVAAAIDFYQRAFGAIELRRWSNPDGSVHVAELAIGGALFHVHEERADAGQLSPETLKATSSQIGLFDDNPDALFDSAIAAGGTVVSPMQDFDYGYRQGIVGDPFGHQWLLEKKI